MGELDKEQVNYIFRYYFNHLTKVEYQAWRHWSTVYKMETSDTSDEQKQRRINVSLQTGWMTDDPDILGLLDDGIAAFKKNIAERIKANHEVEFNNCPKCGRLTRTPQARQCRHCEHSWR